MEDSRLKGGIPAANASDRIWSIPKKRKITDGDPNHGRPRRDGPEQERKEESAPETDSNSELEDLGYGSNGVKKKKNLQVDVVI